jgi:hypothetical protein
MSHKAVHEFASPGLSLKPSPISHTDAMSQVPGVSVDSAQD